mgnify:CR=1 FL=1
MSFLSSTGLFFLTSCAFIRKLTSIYHGGFYRKLCTCLSKRLARCSIRYAVELKNNTTRLNLSYKAVRITLSSTYQVFSFDEPGYRILSGGTHYVFSPSARVTAVGSAIAAENFTGNVVEVRCAVTSVASSGIDLSGGGNNRLTVAATGSVFASSVALNLEGNRNVATNSGDIISERANALSFTGNDNEFVNHGTVTGFTNAVFLSGVRNFAVSHGRMDAYFAAVYVAGTANRSLVPFASRVCEAFPETFASSAKRRTTGNPVREELFLETPREALRNRRPRLLILGGSLGAEPLNKLLPEALAQVSAELRPEVFHQAGKQHAEVTGERYRAAGVEAQVAPFIGDMARAYAWADLVVCRAGALTVSELAAAGLPSFLLPLPHAIDDHQTQNAGYLAREGAAVLLPQRSTDAATLAAQLETVTSATDPADIDRHFAQERHGDLTARGEHKDGHWTLEIKRKRVTTHADSQLHDVQFDDLGKTYYFGVAVFDKAQINHLQRT